MDWHERGRQTKLQEAIGTSRVDVAWAAARRADHVPLPDAARLLSMIRNRDEQFDAGVRRWIVRFALECNPSPEDLRSAAFALVGSF
jgi:hypothetical protein